MKIPSTVLDSSQGLLRLLSALLLPFGCAPAVTAVEPRQSFENSVSTLPYEAATSARAPQAQELAERIPFTFALKLRNFEHLQSRVAKGEIVSRAELEQVYLPLSEDYDTLRKWVLGEGLSITTEDPSRLLLSAEGSIAQVERSLGTTMAAVTVKGVHYKSAVSAPSLPASVGKMVLGINGLQPFRHRFKHPVRQPLTANQPPFLINEILGAYNARNLGVTGAGQKIAILIDTVPKNSDLTAFWASNSIPQNLTNIETVNVNGGTLPAVSGEETLDVEWASGIAPGAKIRVYASRTLNDSDLDNCFSRMINDLPSQPQMHQLSISLGLGETYGTASQFATDNQLLTTLASGGVSIFVSSGDGGSTPDDAGGSSGPLQVENYASDPSVTAVGGTSLFVNSGTGARISESAWNGSGGGVSIIFTNRPSWQVGPGVPTSGPTGTGRLVPDVALAADPNTGAFVILNGSVNQYGGTSWSAPAWAGFCALINQGRSQQSKPPIGLLNPSVYPLIGTTNFFDITTGTNATSTSGGKYACTANYDLVTGIGTPNVSNLFSTLVNAPLPTPSITGFSPISGLVNTLVTINGTNFVSVTNVSFNGVSASFAVTSATQIKANVPFGATTGAIGVSTAGGIANTSSNFTVLSGQPAPSISGFSPAIGLVNSNVVITGSYFSNVVSVTFHGTAAAFSVDTPGQITATVPAGASTGPIAVTTTNSSDQTTTNFVVLAGDGSPVIAGFTPANGMLNSGVVITGANFAGVTSVAFNNVAASYSVDSQTQITTVVPSGASTGPISVTTPYGSVTSSVPFSVLVGSPNVVISQVYGGGGQTGSSYQNDFVELYNRGNAVVNLGTWSVQYASSSGVNWSVTPLSGTIQPGRYLLVKESGGATGAALPVADVTGSINMSGTRGKIALVSSQTPITSGTSSPIGLPSLVDFVGYGTADAYEGSGPAPAPSTTTAAIRAGNGGTDLDDNATDFTAATPNPRNSGTSLSPDLSIRASHTGNFTQGDSNVTYIITVTNVGGVTTAGSVSVVDTLPNGLTAVSMSGSGWTANLGTLTCTRADALGAGAGYPAITLTANVATNAPSSVTNLVSISGGGDTNVANNSWSDPTTINPLSGGGGGAPAGILASWDTSALPGGNGNFGPSPFAGTYTSNITVSGLIRGSGVQSAGTAAARGWGGSAFNDSTAAAAVSANHFATFTISANTGYKISFSSITNFDYRRSTAGPPNGVLQYQIGAGPFVDVTTLSYSSTSSSGASLSPIDLSVISALQNVNAGTNITFRIVNYGGTASTGTWYIFDKGTSTAADFAIAGVVAPLITLSPIEAWRLKYFGTIANGGPAADSAIAAGDGLPNLVKYALNLNPTNPAVSPVTFDVTSGFLRLTSPKNPDATDVTFLSEAAGSVIGAWATNGTTIEQNTSTLLRVRDDAGVSSNVEHYLRLRVSRP